MQAYWLTFTDGTQACCEGQGVYDAVQIAQKMTGKSVVCNGNKWKAESYQVEPLPYPATPIIWQFKHPIQGCTPTFCHKPDLCKGKTSCPNAPCCTS